MAEREDVIHSRIWEEEPEPNNPFAAQRCYCAGYDVYGDLLEKAGWFEYLYLLFKGERPTGEQARMLEALAVALANPGPRDYSVRAAMNSIVSTSTNTSALMAALAVGSGNYHGGRELSNAVAIWREYGPDLERWRTRIGTPPDEEPIDVWKTPEHLPGFDPHGVACPLPVLQSLTHLAELSPSSSRLKWLASHRTMLEEIAGCPLGMVGVAAAALVDLDMDRDQAEMLFLMLRLPGAAAHALEQREYGVAKYPFFANGLTLLENPDAVESEEG
jgi:citrate synthase